jgi:hypothetical protein
MSTPIDNPVSVPPGPQSGPTVGNSTIHPHPGGATSTPDHIRRTGVGTLEARIAALEERVDAIEEKQR